MNEDYVVQDLSNQDTILDESQEYTQEDYAESEFDTPDKDTAAEKDADIDLAHSTVSSKKNVLEPFVSVQYNHKNRDFTKEEAINFIQKGMHTESLRNKLEYVAAAQGTDVNALVEKLVSAPENEHRRYLESLYGKDSMDVEIGMQIFREKQSENYKKIMAERENSIEIENRKKEEKSVISRLANEYIMLKNEVPDAPEYSELPSEVIIEAAEGKRDLYSAYLRYMYKEKMKIDAAKKTQESAASASTGAMKSGGDNSSAMDRNFLSGLWQK